MCTRLMCSPSNNKNIVQTSADGRTVGATQFTEFHWNGKAN